MQMIDGGGAPGWGPHECCGPSGRLYAFTISSRQLRVLCTLFLGLKEVLKSNDKSSCGGNQETIVTWSADFAHLPAVIHH